MKDVLMNILYTIIIGCGTAVTSFLCVFIKNKIGEITSKI